MLMMKFIGAIAVLVVALLPSFFYLAFAGGDKASDVLQLTDENFSQHVGGDVPILVEFYAPWCGHCKALAPEYEVVATSFKGQKVKIASLDADHYKDIAGQHGIEGFPTVKFFAARSTTGEAYNGERSSSAIIDYVNKLIGTSIKTKSAPSSVVVLDDSNFNSIVLDSSKHVFVEFYAPWCGHCKKLAPEWEKLGTAFAGEKELVIAKIDADSHKELGEKYGVKGFPTIKLFSKTNKEGESYNGGRTLENFVDYLNGIAGTERTANGGYKESAGRIPILDALALEFISSSSASAKGDIYHQIQTAIAENSEVKSHVNFAFAKFYEIAAKKELENEDYAEYEINRLNKLLESGKVHQMQIEPFSKRININKLFTKQA